MLARRLPGILPPLAEWEAVECAAIHSAAGLRAEEAVSRRPFRSPHHSTTEAALVGGGQRPRPGEVSLAHNGVLFLDELAEFKRSSLEALRQPLEEGFVTVARHRGVCRMPARFQLVGALNPCPCGRSGQPKLACRCTPGEIKGYLGRLSGPLLDRLDLHVSVPALGLRRGGGPSRRVLGRRAGSVWTAPALDRPSGDARPTLNAPMRSFPRASCDGSRSPIRPGSGSCATPSTASGLSARGLDRVSRVARTISDLC